QPVFELLPEAGRGPVLDGEAGTLGEPVVLAAVEPLQLITESKGVGTALPALAQVVKAKAQRLADSEQPLEVGCAKPKDAAVDRAFGAHQIGVSFAVLRVVREVARGCHFSAGSPVDHAQLVEQDLLGGSRLLQRRSIDHSQQGGDQKLI